MAWRYMPRGGENDTSVTARGAIIALTSAKQAGIKVDPDAFVGARKLGREDDPIPRPGASATTSAAARSRGPEGMQDKFPANRSHAMTAGRTADSRVRSPSSTRALRTSSAAPSCACPARPRGTSADGSVDMYLLVPYGNDGHGADRRIVVAYLERPRVPSGTRRTAAARPGAWSPGTPWARGGNDGGPRLTRRPSWR